MDKQNLLVLYIDSIIYLYIDYLIFFLRRIRSTVE